MHPPTDLLQYGVLGVLCFILLGWIYYKDKQASSELRDLRAAHRAELASVAESLKAEQTLRVEDAKAFTAIALELQSRAIEAVTEIRGIVEEYGELADTVGRLVTVLQEHSSNGSRR